MSSTLSSSSSSSSLLDSSILGASSWNRQKSEQPIQGRPGIGRFWLGFDDIDANETTNTNIVQGVARVNIGGESNSAKAEHRHLLRKRTYPALNLQTSSKSKRDAELTPKSELEAAVLLDCLSTNFLFAHLTKPELNYLVSVFEKVTMRKNEVIVRQGDPADYFYMLFLGDVQLQKKDGKVLKSEEAGEKYTVFGELAILTSSPHDATVKATSSPCTLFRLDRVTFQRVLQPKSQPTSTVEQRFQMLKAAIPTELVEYLQDDEIALHKLVSGMKAHTFQKGDVLFEKGTHIHAFVVISEGQVLTTHLTLGGRSYEDMPIGPGQSQTSFGWLTMEENEPLAGTIVATTDGKALVIPKEVFLNALGGEKSKCGKTTLQHIVAKRLARIELQQITVFRDSALDNLQLNGLLDLMHHCEYADEEVVIKSGEKVDAAMHFVREGRVTLETKGQGTKIIEAGGYFGEKNMLLDQNKDGQKHYSMRSPVTVVAHAATRMDVLYLEECRNVVDTTLLGLGKSTTVSAIDASVQFAGLSRHTLLGSGNFGQVWLASSPKDGAPDEKRVVALKVQAKHKLIDPEQAQHVVAERNIMASLHSPFIIRLFNAFQDDARLYMITSVFLGGELESLIPENGLTEEASKFYAAGILEGLTYLHRRHILHRDLKTANVLINEKGYPVLIDLGFAKYVADKSFTFCGSAMYTAPEIIRYKGHDKGCDHWSWAVLVYRMVTGKYPFYKKGMDELTLYKQICKGTFELDGLVSMEFRMLMVSILYPDPAKRLGSRVNGWRDIIASPWFTGVNLPKLRKQMVTAPWVPDLQDPLDASRFHPDSSESEDLLNESLPGITESQQQMFNCFGPKIS